MTNSTRLALPFIDAAQSQKHVTHNEAIIALDALVHLAVKARNVAAPPGSPAEGDRYLVPSGATGAFASHVNAIAAFDNGGWAFLPAKAGWRVYVEGEGLFLLFDGAAWKDIGLSLQNLQNLSRLGVGATADAANPVLARLNGALFTARATSEGGSGDMRLALNKSAVGNTVSQLYQTNYSGRAETGLTGDDRYRVKVSADGATWRDALSVDPATGQVSLPQTAGVANGVASLDASGKVPSAQLPASAGAGLSSFRNRLRNASFLVNQRNVGGTVTLAAGAYGHDGVKAGAGGCVYAFAQSGTDVTITIASGSLILAVEDKLVEGGVYRLSHAGAALARVWQGTGYTGSGSYAAAPFTTASLTANTQTNVEFSTGTILRPQLEPGSIDTAFERRPTMYELALCQRYYYRRSASALWDQLGVVSASGAATIWGQLFSLPVEMRIDGATVGVSSAGHLTVFNAAISAGYSLPALGGISASRRSVYLSGSASVGGAPGFTAGQALALTFNTTAGWIDVSAEI